MNDASIEGALANGPAAVPIPTGSEEWRHAPGFDGWYDVSSHGRVRSWRTKAKLCCRAAVPQILTGHADEKGYIRVKVTHPVLGKVVVQVQHLVLATYVAPRPQGMVCDHINANPSDNHVTNLHWVTPGENVALAAQRGRMTGREGGRANSSLSEQDVLVIRRLRTEGSTLAAIAERFGVSMQAVSRICLGQSWKEVRS